MPDTLLPFDKRAKPDGNIIERKPLTKWEFATIYLQQQGRCAKCGTKLEPGKTRDEHLDALHLGGGNELTNRALWCLFCTKPKDKKDKKLIAKGARIRGEKGQRARREKFGPTIRKPEGYISPLSKDHPRYRS